WFIKEFNIDNLHDETLLFLYLQNVNFKSVIWLNGQYIGIHEGAFTQFNFNITRHAHIGKNLLVIKVSPFPQQNLSKFTMIYDSSWIQFPGIWGEIYIEFVPRYHIQNVQVKPDIRGKRIVVNVYVNHRDSVLRATIPELNTEIKNKKPKLIIPLKDFETWGPHSPKLYTLQVEFVTPTSSDFAEVQFGMRDFSINENQFTLNFKPFFVRAFHFDWNIKDLNSPSYLDDNLKDFFSKLRKDNFNLILSYGQPLPEKILRICDEHGIMVAQTPSIQSDTNSKKWRELAQTEIEELLNNNINNPSFVWLWFEYTSNNFNISKFVHNIRKIDRSRLITVYSPPPYFKYPSYSCIPYNIHLLTMGQICTQSFDYVNNPTQKFLRNAGEDKILNFAVQTVSGEVEHQNINIRDKYESYISKIKDGFIERDLSLTLTSVENLLEQIKEIHIANLQEYVNSILWNPKIKGYCLQNLSEKSILSSNGFINFLKLPDNVHKQLRQINNPLRLIIALEKTNILQDEEIAINVSFFTQNDEYLSNETENKGLLSIHISSPTQQVLWKKRKDIKFKKDNKVLLYKINQNKDILDYLLNQGYIKVIDDTFITDSRLIIGLGSHHVLETS
ncbi:MAG: sugar-binding domain-containing protein, partial [Candidatus Hydrogenedens sp.]